MNKWKGFTSQPTNGVASHQLCPALTTTLTNYALDKKTELKSYNIIRSYRWDEF